MGQQHRGKAPEDPRSKRGSKVPPRSSQTARRRRSSEPSLVLLLGRITGLGWFVAVSIAGGAIGGGWLDRWADTAPILTLVGLAIGIALAAGGLFKMLKYFGGDPPNRKNSGSGDVSEPPN